MSTVLEDHPNFELTFRLPENGVLTERVKTTALLGATAFWAYTAERNGLDGHLPIVVKQFAESMAHPVLGDLAAWFGIEVARRKPKIAETVALVAATVTDIATEITQDAIVPTNEAAKWYHHPFETSKDYAFALFGAAYFIHQNRKSSGQ